MSKFLSVVTRCYKRPKMLARNKASLEAQTCQDYEHVFLVDEVGVGIAEANRRLTEAQVSGEYVYVLDDDDEISDPNFINDLQAIARQHAPDVIMVRSENGELGILPAVWNKRLIKDHVDMLNFVVKADVFRQHAHAFANGSIGGDFTFINDVFEHGIYRVHWHDKVVARIQKRSHGEPE